MSEQTTPGDMVISFEGVCKSFGSKPVLRDLDLQIRSGETLVILGASGSGKSVLLRHIVGLLEPDAGHVLVFGRDVAELDTDELVELRRRVAMIFQGNALFDSLTVGENVAFGLVERGIRDRTELQRRAAKALADVGLDNVEELMPSSLSGGMRKRVALARSMVLEPEVLLYDEPTAGLDPITGHLVSRLIRDTQRGVGASVVVTHDINSAWLVADRLALLKNGRLVFDGSPEEARRGLQPEVREFLYAYEEG